jgi:hypothetical protein
MRGREQFGGKCSKAVGPGINSALRTLFGGCFHLGTSPAGCFTLISRLVMNYKTGHAHKAQELKAIASRPHIAFSLTVKRGTILCLKTAHPALLPTARSRSGR